MVTKKTVSYYEIESLLESLTETSNLSEDAAAYITDTFWERIETTWGDAELTLVRGSLVHTHLTEIAEDYEDEFHERLTLVLPEDLIHSLVAFDG
jgi:hypothetical protein